MAVLTDFYIKQGDREPPVDATLKRPDGTVKDLTGHSVRFLMRSRLSGEVRVNQPASILSAAAGQVRYSWASGETDVTGEYFGEFETTETATGKKTTFPNKGYFNIHVVDDIG